MRRLLFGAARSLQRRVQPCCAHVAGSVPPPTLRYAAAAPASTKAGTTKAAGKMYFVCESCGADTTKVRCA
ncbi:hypothetical protein EON67_08620 [archaeon]|nr:MAG: hypothetical protein EON67_08620 [archaeon]